jgi:O-antigen ligase
MISSKIKYIDLLCDILILCPIIWMFSGLFLYPDGAKLIVILIGIASITSCYKNGYQHIIDNIKSNKLLWLLGALSAFSIIAYYSYGYSSRQLRALLALFIYLAVIPAFVIAKLNFKYLTILGAITASSFTFIQMVIYSHSRSWDINPIPYATFIASLAIISLYFLLQSKNIKQTAIWMFSTLLSIVPLLLSQSRGLWIALVFTFLVLLIKTIKNKNVNIKLLMSIVLLIIFSLYLSADKIKQRITQTEHEINLIKQGNLKTSIGLRLQMWNAAISLAKESPTIGLGDKHIDYKIQLVKQGLLDQSVIQYTHYHNQFLNELVKYGLIGFVLLIASFFLPIYYFFCYENRYKWPGLLVVLTYAIASLTDVPFQHAQTSIFYFIIVYITLCPLSNKSPTCFQVKEKI